MRLNASASCLLIAFGLILSSCTGKVTPGSSAGATGNEPPGTAQASVPATSSCDPVMGTCLGVLRAGTYSSTSFTPEITYTVPDGWENIEDKPNDFLLTRTADPSVSGFGPNTIGVSRDVLATAQDCTHNPAPAVGHSARELAAWMHGLAGLKTTVPKPASLAGLAGVVVDVTIADGWQKTCDWAPDTPVVSLFVVGAASQFRKSSKFTAPGATDRLFLLDRADGGTILVDILDVPGGISFAEYLTVAAPIVQHLRLAG